MRWSGAEHFRLEISYVPCDLMDTADICNCCRNHRYGCPNPEPRTNMGTDRPTTPTSHMVLGGVLRCEDWVLNEYDEWELYVHDCGI
jgi:hypothetical protein